MLKEIIFKVHERVSKDCSTGSGSMFKVGKWIIGRTRHLDDPRPPSEKERDAGFFCKEFVAVVKMFLKKRPMNIESGKYHLVYKNKRGYQNCVVAVDNRFNTMTFITIIQMNKRSITDYKIKSGDKRIFIGELYD